MKISIVIPTFNEEKTISTCLSQFKGKLSETEIIVVDGGSTDDTLEKARYFPAIKIFSADKLSRSYQMNKGAEAATGDWLLFLHADTLLPANWENEVVKAKAGGYKAGCFRVEHGKHESMTLRDKVHARLVDLRTHYQRYPYGDQAIFIDKNIFEELDGYKDIPIMEDYEFSRRVYKKYGEFYRSKKTAAPSFIRFKGKFWRTGLAMLATPQLYKLGVSPQWLAKLNKEIR
ncbi:TIGR04283 family arsenosugar biosynthesis glycosyltransferase [Candidatus Margulisiibacteriota bacterium]